MLYDFFTFMSGLLHFVHSPQWMLESFDTQHLSRHGIICAGVSTISRIRSNFKIEICKSPACDKNLYGIFAKLSFAFSAQHGGREIFLFVVCKWKICLHVQCLGGGFEFRNDNTIGRKKGSLLVFHSWFPTQNTKPTFCPLFKCGKTNKFARAFCGPPSVEIF